jgi:hypothetical protein
MADATARRDDRNTMVLVRLGNVDDGWREKSVHRKQETPKEPKEPKERKEKHN